MEQCYQAMKFPDVAIQALEASGISSNFNVYIAAEKVRRKTPKCFVQREAMLRSLRGRTKQKAGHVFFFNIFVERFSAG